MLSILAFQIKEIEGAELKEGEDDELEGKINKASHAEHLKDNLRDAIFALEGGERQTGAIEQLETIHRSLEKASTYDDTFSAFPARSKPCPMKSKISTTPSCVMPIPSTLTNGLWTPCSHVWQPLKN